MTPATALPPQIRAAHELSGEKYTAQANSTGTPLPKIRVETYHAKLCDLLTAEYHGRAYANTLVLRPGAVEVENERADAFARLGARLRLACRGQRQIIRGPDIELVRWHQLTLLRACVSNPTVWKQKVREVAALLELLNQAIAGNVEHLTAAVPRA